MSNNKTTTVQSAAQALIDYLDSMPHQFSGEGKTGYNLKEDLKKALKEEAKTTNIQIQFANKKVADGFCEWLCNQGEQDYFNAMEYREKEEDGDITVVSFHYHGKEDETKAKNDPKRYLLHRVIGFMGNTKYGGFMEDGIIRTECGRLD